jgi:ribose/xylose/arabinose/galactoside ABC-type transport system permease subunit
VKRTNMLSIFFRKLRSWGRVMRGNQLMASLFILFVLMLFFTMTSSRFLTWDNMQNVTRSTSSVVIVGSAVTLVMIARGLDLSVGSLLAASGVLAASIASHGTNLWLSYLAAIALGALFGALNGTLVVGFKVTPIIATLGTLNIARGMAYLVTPSAILVGLPSNWSDLGTGSFFQIPFPVIIAVVIALFFGWLLGRTVFGRHVYAIGGNEETARLSGVNIRKVIFLLYLMSGLATGIAAVVLTSRLGSGDPNIGVGFEFQVIVAVILGGTSLAGGEGRIAGTIVGALIVGFLGNGLNLIGVEPFWQYVAQGVALIAAVILDRFTRRERSEASVRREVNSKDNFDKTEDPKSIGNSSSHQGEIS